MMRVLARWQRRANSLRLRLMLGSACLAFVFILLLIPLLQQVFANALEQMVEKRLAADAASLISAAYIEHGQLKMPAQMPDEQFDNLNSDVWGFIFDKHGQLIWRSPSSLNVELQYRPVYDGQGHEFVRVQAEDGAEYFLYDIEVALLGDEPIALSIVTIEPGDEYQALFTDFTWQMRLWLGGALLVLLGLLWFGMTWGLWRLRSLRNELNEVEAGKRQVLSDDHPQELLRLTRSLNRLLDSERHQRERYRDSLEDLAHSLKTPLSALQGIAEQLSSQAQTREQAALMQAQIERMSQQVSYQLQRASLRRSGLVRHHEQLKPLLDDLGRSLDKVYHDKGVQARFSVPDGLLINMERGALMELLGNLLENAYRLCISQVCVSARYQNGLIELCVEDDGPGVPAAQRERVMRRGVRLDRLNPGQGVGLAVVQDIIDSYDGELVLEDSALDGACFRVRLND